MIRQTDPHASSIAQRAEVHRALADVLRLAIIEALALSDLTPSEVERRFDVPSNLLAHHLAILEGAGLVARTRSQGDGRRRYLSLQPAALVAAGVTLPSSVPLEARRVVFVCTQNSARSPLASALWDAAGTDIPSTSAGTHPANAVHPHAVAAGRRAGLDIRHTPRSLDDVEQEGDLLVTVCDRAHEESDTPQGEALHWSVPDPAREGRPEAFADTVAMLRDRVLRLAELTVPSLEATPGPATPRSPTNTSR